jgi:hypothetical protein
VSHSRLTLLFLAVCIGTPTAVPRSPLSHGTKRQAAERTAQQSPAPQHEPTAAEMSRDETPGKALLRQFEGQEYEVRSAAEAMPADKWSYRPAQGLFKNEKPAFGPAEVRSFGEQVKHVAAISLSLPSSMVPRPRMAATRAARVRRKHAQNCSSICATPSPR